ncbi:Ig-like domain-containing protein [Mycobacterium sp. SMC-4]|uniref:Ig-like domain-containing protein n=1 Tax=Mycobacterium sp. SMC-4 TaxID=2857059 RepID=UPI003D01E12E
MSVGKRRRQDASSKARHQRLKNPSYAQATYPTFSLAGDTVGQVVPKITAGNHAKYIGRVGMLAVALGVGAAVTTGHGLGAAHADTGVTSTDSPTRDSRSDDASRRPSSSPTTPGASTNPVSGDTATDVELDEIDTVDNEFEDVELEDPETGDAELDDSDAVDEPTFDVDDETDLPDEVEGVPSLEDSPADEPKSESKRQSASPLSARRSAADAAPLTGPEGSGESTTSEPPIVSNDPELPSGLESTTPDENEEESASDAVHTPLANDGSQPRAAAASASAPDAVTAVDGVQEFVSTLLAPLVSPGPTAPAHPPLLWAVLGWISREIQRTFFNRTPDVRPQDISLVLEPGETSGPISFDGHDAERDAITYYVPTRGVPGGPQHGTVVVDQATGTFTYTPDPGFTGTDEFVVTASDAGNRFHLHGLFGFLKPNRGHAHSAKITLDIGAPAGAPTATNDTYQTAENDVVVGNVLSNDGGPAHQNLVATLLSRPSHGSVTLNANGEFTYTPDPDWSGTDEFTYTASNPTSSSVASVTITVTPVNRAPIAVDDHYTTTEDTPISRNVLTNDSDREGSPVTAEVVTGASHGVVEFNADGSFTYTPNTDFNGIDHFSYVASDGLLTSAPTLVTITVVAANDAPVAHDDSFSIDEDAILTGSVLHNDTDVDSDPLTVSLTSGPTHGQLDLNPDGTFTFTPFADYNGTDSFTYTVSDGTATATATATITIAPVNDAPIAHDGSFTVGEGTSHTGTVNIEDAEDGTLTATVVDGPNHGTLTMNTDGSFIYTPNANYSGTDWFAYAVSDGTLSSAPAVVQIVITPANNAPVAHDDVYSMNEDAILAGSVLFNDNDVDRDTLTATVASGPGHGVLVLLPNGSFIYTPTANYAGTDSFTYTVSDGTVTSNTATVTITVNPVNDPPVAGDDIYDVDEGGKLTGNVLSNDRDVESPSLTAALVDGPANGTVVLNSDGTFTYTPAANFDGVDWFTYTASDGTAVSTPAVVVVVVKPVNNAPVATDDSYTVVEDGVLVGDVLSNDVDSDNDSLTVSLVKGPVHGVLEFNDDGTFVYTPGANYNGVDSFTYIVGDGSLTSQEATVTITVTPVNNAPVAVGDSFSTDEDRELSGNVLTNDTDIDEDSLTAELVAGPAHGTLVLNADGTFTYTPTTNYHGTDTFTYQVSDGEATSSVTTVSLTINPVNDAPVAHGDSFVIDEDSVLTGDLLTNDTDIDQDDLTATVVAGPAHGTLILNADGTFTYTPTADYHGTDTFTYQVSDGEATSSVTTVSLTINSVNDAPVAGNDSFTFDEDHMLTGGVLDNDNDNDGNPLTATLVDGPANGTLTFNADGTFTYTPDADYHGTDTFTYTVNDGTTTSSVATVSLTINSVNDAPVAGNDGFTVGEDTPLAGNVLTNDNDVDRDTLTATVVTGPAHGTLILNADGSFSYIADPDYNGVDSFTYRASDGSTTGNTALVTIAVTAVNDAPVANHDSVTTNEDTPVTGNVLTNDRDADGNPLTATLVEGPANGTLTFNADGTFTYTPDADSNGTDTFTYIVNDGTTTSSVATVSISVNPVNDAPVAGNDNFTTDEDTPLTGNVLTNDRDADGNPLTATLVTGPAHGTLTLNADGTFTYTPTADYNGTDSFTYTAGDGTAASTTATVIVTVKPVNDAPVATDDAYTTNEDTELTGNVLTNDRDADGNPLTATVVTGPANGTLTFNADGTFTYTPTANYNGTDTFTYEVSDGTTTSSVATVSITINPVNDAPVAGNDSFTTDEDTELTGNVLTNDRDAEGKPLTATLVTGPAHGTLTLNADGSFEYNPHANYSGTDVFTYTISDGTLTSHVAIVSIAVTAVNDAPVAVGDSYTIKEDTPLTGNVLTNDTDVDGNTLTAILVDDPANGTVTFGKDGTFTYTPNANHHGTDTFTYTVSDGTNTSALATVTITIDPVNNAPTAVGDSFTTNEDTALTGNVLTNDSDVDRDPLTATLVTGPAHGTLTLNANGTFTYTPTANHNGTDSFSYAAGDGVTSSVATVTIAVNPVNDAPVATGDTVTTTQNTTVIVDVRTNDTDVDNPKANLKATVRTQPKNGTVALNADGTFTYTPKLDFTGTDSFTYTVSDGTATSNIATVSITVVDNIAPRAVNVQTTNSGSLSGIMDRGDTITYTFSEPIDPTSILAGWDGTTTEVVVRASGDVGSNDIVQVYDASNDSLLPLGTIDLGRGDYVVGLGYLRFGTAVSPSRMTMTGNTITVVLGLLVPLGPGQNLFPSGSGTMVWTPSTTPRDLAGNALASTPATETGSADRDF